MSERVFAVFTNVLKEFRKIRWTNASALAQGSINHDVGLRCRPVTRGGKFTGSRGQPLLYDIPPHEAEALFEMARTDYKVVHKEDERQKLRQMEVALQGMAFQVTRKLRLTAAKYGKSLEWLERSEKEKLTTVAALNAALKEEKDEKRKIELLMVQIAIRVKGYGWTRFNMAWSSAADKSVGSVKDLTAKAKEMIGAEINERLVPPSEPPVPDAATKRLKTLGR